MKRTFFALAALAGYLVPGVVLAHAFGQQYNLPVPASFYILGGVCAFIASSAVIMLFNEPTGSSRKSAVALWKVPTHVDPLVRGVGMAVFLFFIATAFIGSQDWTINPAVPIFWIWLLLAFTYLTAIIDGLWERLNPFRTIATFFRNDTNPRPYPAWLGYIPAILLWAGLIWMELFSNGLAIFPVWLGGTAIIYAWLCAAASNSFGMDVWFEHGEVFTVFFGLVGRFAPFRLTSQGLEAGAPARSLIAEKAPSITLIIFILFTLASTAIDGLKDTFPWLRVVVYLLPKIGVKVSSNAFGIAALFLLPTIFFGLYALAIYAGKLLTKSALRFHELLLGFGFSLVPISIAYHFAHYVDLLIGESQLLIPELSDPFGAGWNLFHTKDFVPNYIPIGANTIWYIQLTAIVVGHVIAAIIAHIIATRTFTSKRDIILSQIPMLVLMVFYTAFGLWILSQPFAPLS